MNIERWFLSSNAKDILRQKGFVWLNVLISITPVNWTLNTKYLGSARTPDSLLRAAPSNEMMSWVLMTSLNTVVALIYSGTACWIHIHFTWAKANHHIKTGPLATVEGQHVTVGNTMTIFSYIVKKGAPHYPIPEQMADEMNPQSSEYRQNLSLGTSETSGVSNSSEHPWSSSTGLYKTNLKGVQLLNDLWNIIWWTVTNLSTTNSIKRPVADSRDGGKIPKKAKAIGNAIDTGYIAFPAIKPQTCNHGQNLGLLLLTNKPYLSNTRLNYARGRYYSTYRKDLNTLKWNTNWKTIERKVLEDQKKLVKLASSSETNDYGKVYKQQRSLALKLEFRLLAVHQTLTNKGGRTPGIDNFVPTSDIEKWRLVEQLKEIILKPETYKAQPVKRIYIPKGDGRERPLGIPTILDRCLQALINLVLEPLVEMNSDRHNYGFRKYRSQKMAIGMVRRNLRSEAGNYTKYVLDADIVGFFDNISHQWLLSNVPLETRLTKFLKAWLKSGHMDQGTFVEAKTGGTPQGGIISPTLANLTLNGLERAVEDSIKGKYHLKQRGIYIGKRNNSKGNMQYSYLSSNLSITRFVDDFIIFARSKRMLVECVKPAVEAFLNERGLSLSTQKTKIISIEKGEKLNFLGYTFQYFGKLSYKYKLFHERQELDGIACYPQKAKYESIVNRIKSVFDESKNLSAYTIIAKLNPMIRGWSQYFNLGQSYKYRNDLNHALYKLVWKWAQRKHPRWGKINIARKYFLRVQEKQPDELRKFNTKTGNTNKWVFRGLTEDQSIYKESNGGKSIELVNPTQIVPTMSAMGYRIPKELESVHAYHPLINKLIEHNITVGLRALKTNKTTKVILLSKQKGKCGMCGENLLNQMGEMNYDGSLHIHHVVNRAKGGSKYKMTNLSLVHTQCHINHHRDVS